MQLNLSRSIGLTFVDIDFTDDKGTTHLQGKMAPNGIASENVRTLGCHMAVDIPV